MPNWLKTYCAPTSPWAVRLIHSPAAVITTIILLGSTTLAQSAPRSQELSANNLARRVVSNELKFQDEDHAQWAYRQEKEESGKKQIKRIIETKDDALSRLLSIDDHPLTAKQLQKENQRIQELVNNPAEQRKLQRTRNTETEPGRRLFKMLPDSPGRLLCHLNHPLRRGFIVTIFRHTFGCLVNFGQTEISKATGCPSGG